MFRLISFLKWIYFKMFTNIDWHIQYLPEKEGKGGGGRKENMS